MHRQPEQCTHVAGYTCEGYCLSFLFDQDLVCIKHSAVSTTGIRHFFIPRRPEKTRQDPKRPEKTRQDPKRPEKTHLFIPKRPEKTRKDALIYTEKTRKDPKRPEKTRNDPKRRPKRPKKTRKDIFIVDVSGWKMTRIMLLYNK